MTNEQQLAWERRAGRFAGAAGLVSAFVGLAALVASASALKPTPNDEVEEAILFHKHASTAIAASVLQAISIGLLTVVLAYLYRATRHRRPQVPRVAWYLALIAPPIVGALTVVRQVQVTSASNEIFKKLPYPGSPKEAIDYASHKLTAGTAATIGGIALAAGLALAIGIGLVSINARRAGLLSGFMGILGVIVGVLLVIPILGPPVVQYFWVVALGLLFLDRWPGQGRGPAWETGEAEPWPTAADQRAAMDAERGRDATPRGTRRADPETMERLESGAADDEEGDPDADDGQPVAAQHPRSKKRKRKRRR